MPLRRPNSIRVGNSNRILFTPIGKVTERQLAAERLVPIHVLNQLLDLIRSAAGRIDAADQASHAGAGDQVHRHVVLVEPLQHANVRQAERTAPFEHQADFLPRFRVGLLRRRILGVQGNGHEKQEEHRRRCPAAHRRQRLSCPCLDSSKVHHRPQLSARDSTILGAHAGKHLSLEEPAAADHGSASSAERSSRSGF